MNTANSTRLSTSPGDFGLGRFLLMLIAFIPSGFLLVYGLVGWIIEGDSLLRWQYEALEVVSYSALVALAWAGLAAWTAKRQQSAPLLWSAWGHSVVAMVVWVAVWLRV